MALLAGLLPVISAERARAQISPGPLSEAHEELDGTLSCFKCHGVGSGAMDSHCLECHRGISILVQRGRGLHGREAHEECSSCHPEHAGRDFGLIAWEGGDASGFDHGRTGWKLTGSHGALACATCHTPELQLDPVVGLLKRRDRGSSWLGLQAECRSCHADPHEGRFESTCENCHSTSGWSDLTREGFDHDRTRYPLRGAHVRVDCASCHDTESAWGRKPRFAKCAECHSDPHAGQATREAKSVDCDGCHDVERFRPSTFTVAMHRASPYPLEGAHREVACRGCHRADGPADPSRIGSAGVLLRRPHDRCRDCHADSHAGQLADVANGGACESCHDPRGWKPTLFGVEEHAKTALPLEGRHAELACEACHASEAPGLAAHPATTALGPAGVAFDLGDGTCGSCHVDPHEGRFALESRPVLADGCRSCHGADNFRPSLVDHLLHDRLGFTLEGAHRAIPCVLCHEELSRAAEGSTLILGKGRVPLLPFSSRRGECADCHPSPHGDQFVGRAAGSACDDCHGLEAFQPATRFDHDRDSRFPLAGAHSAVACAQCHGATRQGEAGSSASAVVYRPTPIECSACHGDSIREHR